MQIVAAMSSGIAESGRQRSEGGASVPASEVGSSPLVHASSAAAYASQPCTSAPSSAQVKRALAAQVK